jgi:hypothetical protein
VEKIEGEFREYSPAFRPGIINTSFCAVLFKEKNDSGLCLGNCPESSIQQEENTMNQLIRLIKRLNEANLCTEQDENGYFCAQKRPCPLHEKKEDRPLTNGDGPLVPLPAFNRGKDSER